MTFMLNMHVCHIAEQFLLEKVVGTYEFIVRSYYIAMMSDTLGNS